MRLKSMSFASAAIAAVSFATAGFAQTDASASAASEEADDTQLGEIIVTATRRSADLQSVPASIVAVTSASLKSLNIDSILQLPTLVPGLIAQPAGGNNLFLRGIGSASTGYNEGQNAVYLDGLYLANPAAGVTGFNNIERIEVLKGPQGTLYGRNVTGGLVSVITRDPGDEIKVDMSLGYANYDTASFNFYGSAPLGANLAASVAVFGQKQNKGWSVNVFDGHRDQLQKEIGVQAKLVWRPGENTKVTGTYIYDSNNRDVGFVRQVVPGTLASDGTPNLGEYRFASRIDPQAPFHISIGSLKIEQDLGFATLMSLTGFQKSEQRVLFGGAQAGLGQTITGLGVPTNDFLQQSRSWSQEFQLASHNTASRLDWVAGAFFFDDKTRLRLDTYNTCIGNVCAPGFTSTSSDGRPTTRSYSVYGDATYRVLEHTKLTLGVRYTGETKGLSGLLSPLAGRPNSVAAIPVPAGTVTAFQPGQPYTLNVAGVPVLQPGIPTSSKFDAVTYRVVLSQDLGENVHLYLSHNYGFKSGAYNGNAFNNPPVRPEKLYSYEAGFKSELFDRRLRLNVAYFHYDYKDIQIRSSAPPAPPGNVLLLNIAQSRYDGVDADFSLVAAKGLTINGGFEYLNARFVDYPGASCITFATATVSGVLVGSPRTATCNLAGFQVPNAPKFSGAIGFTYAVETGMGKFTLNANDRFNASYPMTPAGEIRQEQHHLVDASLQWASLNKSYDIKLWVRNLADQYTYGSALAGRDLIVTPGAPRTFGVTAGAHF